MPTEAEASGYWRDKTATKTADGPTPVERIVNARAELAERRPRYAWVNYYDRKAHRRVNRKMHAGRTSLLAILEYDAARDDDTEPKQAGGGLTRGFESRPPGRYAPRELLDDVNRKLSIWLGWFGLVERDGIAAHLDAIAHIADVVEDQEALTQCAVELERIVERLRSYAGLDRIFQPRATCPKCDRLGTLTIWVNEDTRQPERARCSAPACRAKWDTTSVGVLLEHVRGERKTKAKVKVTA